MFIMTTRTKKLTFAEWQRLPETKERYEIVDGVMYMPPGPNPYHQWVLLEVYKTLSDFVRLRQLGVVLAAPLDLMIQSEPLRVRQPDLLYLNTNRTGITEGKDLRGFQYLEVAPDLVIEILSPGNTRREMEEKLRDYQRIGVYQCWLFSPQAETAEIIDLTGAAIRSVALFGIADTLRSDLIPGFELKLAEIFG